LVVFDRISYLYCNKKMFIISHHYCRALDHPKIERKKYPIDKVLINILLFKGYNVGEATPLPKLPKVDVEKRTDAKSCSHNNICCR
jgi:hypothetical protein